MRKTLIGLLLAATVGAVIYHNQETSRPAPTKWTDILAQVKLVSFEPRFDYGKAHVLADFSIRNDTLITFTTVVLRCQYKDSLGATVYDNSLNMNSPIPPDTTKAFTQIWMTNIKDGMRTVTCSLVNGH